MTASEYVSGGQEMAPLKLAAELNCSVTQQNRRALVQLIRYRQIHQTVFIEVSGQHQRWPVSGVQRSGIGESAFAVTEQQGNLVARKMAPRDPPNPVAVHIRHGNRSGGWFPHSKLTAAANVRRRGPRAGDIVVAFICRDEIVGCRRS